ncbi:MAG: hypothetical protein QNJ97_18005 [Myxococcota bacterium]|nr:hypothetical protein [Myxococcota bacterium]
MLTVLDNYHENTGHEDKEVDTSLVVGDKKYCLQDLMCRRSSFGAIDAVGLTQLNHGANFTLLVIVECAHAVELRESKKARSSIFQNNSKILGLWMGYSYLLGLFRSQAFSSSS